jgi:hypothetical protein
VARPRLWCPFLLGALAPQDDVTTEAAEMETYCGHCDICKATLRVGPLWYHRDGSDEDLCYKHWQGLGELDRAAFRNVDAAARLGGDRAGYAIDQGTLALCLTDVAMADGAQVGDPRDQATSTGGGEVSNHDSDYGAEGAKQLAEVDLSVVVETNFGDTVRVVGSTGELGAWDASRGPELTTEPCTYPRWSVSLRLSASACADGVEYKFVVVQRDGTLRWEEGSNRTLLLEGLSDPELPVDSGDARTTAPRFGEALLGLPKAHQLPLSEADIDGTGAATRATRPDDLFKLQGA